MKRVAAVLLSIALLCPVISRAEYDLSAMSDADLLQLRTEINLELLSRQPQPADALGSGMVNDCTVTLRAIKLGKTEMATMVPRCSSRLPMAAQARPTFSM